MIIILVLYYRCKSWGFEGKKCLFKVTKLVTELWFLSTNLDPERMFLITTQQWPPLPLWEGGKMQKQRGWEDREALLCAPPTYHGLSRPGITRPELHLLEKGTQILQDRKQSSIIRQFSTNEATDWSRVLQRQAHTVLEGLSLANDFWENSLDFLPSVSLYMRWDGGNVY